MSKNERSGIEIVRTYSALEALGAEWASLTGPTELPMLSHEWVVSCAETLYGKDDLYVVTVRDRGVLTAVAPLAIRRSAGLGHLEVIGSSFLYEPSGLLYSTDDALSTLVEAILDIRRPIVLSRIPSASPLIQHFKSRHDLVLVGRVSGMLSVPITSDWDQYLSRLSSRRRYDLRRARRRAENAGPIRVRNDSPGPGGAAEAFAEFVRIESSGWKAGNGSSLSHRHHLRRFFSAYATRAAAAGRLRISFLDIGDTSVAAQLAVEHAERLWVLKIGYDEAWSRCSPGWQLLAETMRDAFERRLKSYEFLGSDEAWLHGWAVERTDLSTLATYPTTLLGVYGLATDTVGRVRARMASWSHRREQARAAARA